MPLGSCLPGINHILFSNEYHTIRCVGYPNLLVGTDFSERGKDIPAHLVPQKLCSYLGITLLESWFGSHQKAHRNLAWKVCSGGYIINPVILRTRRFVVGDVDILEGCPYEGGNTVSVSSYLQISWPCDEDYCIIMNDSWWSSGGHNTRTKRNYKCGDIESLVWKRIGRSIWIALSLPSLRIRIAEIGAPLSYITVEDMGITKFLAMS